MMQTEVQVQDVTYILKSALSWVDLEDLPAHKFRLFVTGGGAIEDAVTEFEQDGESSRVEVQLTTAEYTLALLRAFVVATANEAGKQRPMTEARLRELHPYHARALKTRCEALLEAQTAALAELEDGNPTTPRS